MLPKRARSLAALFIALCLLSFALACGSSEDDEDTEGAGGGDAPATAGVKYTPSGNEGTLTGTIAFNGEAPAEKRISMDQDPACVQANPNAVAEDVVIKDGKVQYVFVYVKDGKLADGKNITGFSFAPPAEARVLDQKGCQYQPHVIGIQTGQKLSITNSDQTTHNVNAQPTTNTKFNQAQSANAAPIEKTFQRPETLIPVKCNQHPWMKAWIGVLNHPFYAVSGPDGKFEIKGLPPGTYTVEAWHEKFKTAPQQITVGAKESKTADFTLSAGGATASVEGGSLEILPALDLPMLMKH